jgi:hypothetical protein
MTGLSAPATNVGCPIQAPFLGLSGMRSTPSADVLISLGRDGKTGSGTSRAVIPLKPKNGLNGA